MLCTSDIFLQKLTKYLININYLFLLFIVLNPLKSHINDITEACGPSLTMV